MKNKPIKTFEIKYSKKCEGTARVYTTTQREAIQRIKKYNFDENYERPNAEYKFKFNQFREVK